MNKKISIGLMLLAFLLFFSILFASSGEIDLRQRLLPPGRNHILGCDTFGRDLASRIAGGIAVSMAIATAVTILSMTLGIIIGSASSIKGLLFLVGFSDCLKSLPPIVLALFLASLVGPGSIKLILALSLCHTANVSRSVYSKTEVLRKMPYVETARLEGMGRLKLYVVHIIPNMKGYILAQSVSIFSSAMLSESSLSFLGCGVKPPTPSLGSILAEARPVMLSSSHMVVFPSIAILLIAFSLGFISKGISELDPSSH